MSLSNIPYTFWKHEELSIISSAHIIISWNESTRASRWLAIAGTPGIRNADGSWSVNWLRPAAPLTKKYKSAVFRRTAPRRFQARSRDGSEWKGECNMIARTRCVEHLPFISHIESRFSKVKSIFKTSGITGLPRSSRRLSPLSPFAPYEIKTCKRTRGFLLSQGVKVISAEVITGYGYSVVATKPIEHIAIHRAKGLKGLARMSKYTRI